MKSLKEKVKIIIKDADINNDLALKLKDERCKLIYDIALRHFKNMSKEEARAGVREAKAPAPVRA